MSCCRWSACPTPERSIQARCRVASSSVSRSRARWRRRPSLLLLDEPLSALDAKVRERLRGEIRQLQRRLRVTTIMVTHDQEEALSMADRVVVMNDGVIEQVGTASEVYERADDPIRRRFSGQGQRVEGHVRSAVADIVSAASI